MRVPVDGGAPQPVVAVSPEAGGHANRFQTVHLHCSVHGRCVMAERDGAGVRVFSVDPGRGKGAELGRFPANLTAATLSPDGESVAFVIPGDDGRRNRIRFMSFEGKAAPDLVISQASWLSSLDALASGSGFLSVDVAAAGAERRLLFIRPDGTSHVLWSERRAARDLGYSITRRQAHCAQCAADATRRLDDDRFLIVCLAARHSHLLGPVSEDAAKDRVLLVVGYSGEHLRCESADGTTTSALARKVARERPTTRMIRDVDTAWVPLLTANCRTCITFRHIEGEPASTPCEAACAHWRQVRVLFGRIWSSYSGRST